LPPHDQHLGHRRENRIGMEALASACAPRASIVRRGAINLFIAVSGIAATSDLPRSCYAPSEQANSLRRRHSR
jgi:hypothetical protein